MRAAAFHLGALVVPVWLLAVAASAQSPPAAPARADEAEMRNQVSMLEAVLERAVQNGMNNALRRIPGAELSPPIFSGQHRARGFHVASYGVFVDVEMPDLPVTFTWSIQMLGLNDAAIARELSRMKGVVSSVSDPKQRGDLEQSIVRLQQLAGSSSEQEQRLAAGAAATPGASAKRVSATETSSPGQMSPTAVLPPDAAYAQIHDIYRSEVQKVLVNAMLDQGRALQLAPGERLTVAARAEGPTTIGPGEQNTTLFLTILGKDLSAYSAGQITREEAVKRVEATTR